jgi:hypothetical protein
LLFGVGWKCVIERRALQPPGGAKKKKVMNNYDGKVFIRRASRCRFSATSSGDLASNLIYIFRPFLRNVRIISLNSSYLNMYARWWRDVNFFYFSPLNETMIAAFSPSVHRTSCLAVAKQIFVNLKDFYWNIFHLRAEWNVAVSAI